MKKDILLNALLEQIRKKTPPGINTASMLSDILCIGKEAVYRRLRGEVPFTFSEISRISEKLNISIDRVIGLSIPDHILLHLDLMRFESVREVDHDFYLRAVDFLNELGTDPESEMGSCANTLPISFMLKYRSLAEFRVFNWMYQYEPVGKVRPLHEMDYPEESQEFCDEVVRALRGIGHSYYILDNTVFENLINHITYFSRLRLIGEEDKLRIKTDLNLLLDELEGITLKGVYETGKKVQIYISHLNLEATYSYYSGHHTMLTLIKFFSMNSITTQDAVIFEKMNNWIQSLKRMSTLISESGEIQRVRFFQKQRELVDNL